jgi:uncharacterized coiled-coil protein SlyX
MPEATLEQRMTATEKTVRDLQEAVNELPGTMEQLSVPTRALLPILATTGASNSSCGGRCGHYGEAIRVA